jgi:malate synthase
MSIPEQAEGVTISGPVTAEYAEILTPEALAFVAGLARTFEGRRQELLARRQERWAALKAGTLPDFLPETASVRPADGDQRAELGRKRVYVGL